MPLTKRSTPSRSLPLLAAFVLLLASACGDNQSDFANFEAVSLTAEPTAIIFPAVGLGQESVQILNIQNNSETEAVLNIELREVATAQDQEEEFFWPEGLDQALAQEVVLAPLERLQLSVGYKPTNTASDSGSVIINYNNPDRGPIVVPLSTTDANPDIDGPSRVLFGRVPAMSEAQKTITLQNVGSSPLTLREMVLSTEQEFSFCLPASANSTDCPTPTTGDFPLEMEPLETLAVRINYAPNNDGEDIATLRVVSDDPDESSFNININANGSQPCILVDGEGGFDFGTGFIGGVSSRTLSITNCSPNKELIVDGIRLLEDSDSAFSLGNLPADLPDGPATIPVDETASFVLNYAPEAETENSATLEVISNDEAKSPLLIPIVGTGSNNACPIPIARIKEVGAADVWSDTLDTIPLATIQFDGTQSSDPDAPNDPQAIAAYEWTVISRPAGSTSTFIPNNTEPNPQLFIDLAGTYVVELRVFDRQNIPSCSTARAVIIANPDEDVHIQLVWDTPGDPDQTDTGRGKGADLDLHFLHPRGNWNAEPWDCYWLNPIAPWATSSSLDDPSLDIDDTDGSGPENINLNNPEEVAYRVGVFYFSDHNFGPTYATLRIYLQQVLVFELRDKFLDRTGRFWDAASIEWGPMPRVSQVDQLYDGFP
jgi:hypothetical protein